MNGAPTLRRQVWVAIHILAGRATGFVPGGTAAGPHVSGRPPVVSTAVVNKLAGPVPAVESRGRSPDAASAGDHPEIPTVIFVVGPPGCGKGTVCGKLVRDFNVVHISAGALLRKEHDSDSEWSEQVRKIYKPGHLVDESPAEITCNLIRREMHAQGWGDKAFLIDGFPRNAENLKGWQEVLEGEVNVGFVLWLNCVDEDTMIQRILRRAVEDGKAGRVRNGDNVEWARARYQNYRDRTLPIIKQYEDRGMVRLVNASCSPEEVYNSCKRIISKGVEGLGGQGSRLQQSALAS